MADSRRCALTPQLDIEQILLEAQNRWLRPSEVCEILRNYQKFCLSPEPPYKPPGGSLFLFDRKALRYFRKDGHCWRKKKDGKTVREAHEKLKAGSVDVLHCYYAHGENNENFQRRSYWMLDGQLEHIVLVHYREVVKEGNNRSSAPRLLNVVPQTLNHNRGGQVNPAACSVQTNAPALAAQPSYASSPITANWNGQTPSSEIEDGDSGDDLGASSIPNPVSCSGFQIASFQSNNLVEKGQLGYEGTVSDPYMRGFTDATGTSGGLVNTHSVSQVATLNLLPNEGSHANHRTSPEAGIVLSSEYLGASFSQCAGSSTWSESFSSNRNFTSMYKQKHFLNETNDADVLTEKLTDYTADPSLVKNGQDGRIFLHAHSQTLTRNSFEENHKERNDGCAGHFLSDNQIGNDMNYTYQVPDEHNFGSSIQFQSGGSSFMDVATNGQSFGSEDQNLKKAQERSLYNKRGELKELDSFGRWMNNEIGKDCDDSLMASDSCNYWNSLETQNGGKEVSNLSCHTQFDVDSLGPSLLQEQLFSILDFSPDWAFSGVETKVLISGKFLGRGENPSICRWCCMFGEIEIPAEVLTTNTLRCHAPLHVPGRVPFYITCSNRVACSEVRDFEYREKPYAFIVSLGDKCKPEEEMQLQLRFAKILFQGVEKKRLDCSLETCEKGCLKDIFSIKSADGSEWDKIETAMSSMEYDPENLREALMQKLLKDRLYEWLICKAHEEGKGASILDDAGQGVIHLAAALGYEWAISPIITAGVSPSFRDACGWTGLHWAAYFGREETVVTLVRLGAAPGAVDNPTSKSPEGRTAADVASSRGHKGIAGYLAEADLTHHLSSLTLKESVWGNVMDGSVNLTNDNANGTFDDLSISHLYNDEDQLSLIGSLNAVRNSAQAAARIQAAFRVHSFCQRQLTKYDNDSSVASSELIAVASLAKSQQVGHFSDSLHAAAVRIQQKYCGWKGRKEFLKIRNRIIRIQAHVRGHQVRKQYKRVVWSVSIVEKAILRWRRKGAGLRGFRADMAVRNVEPETEKTDEYEFLRVGRKQKVAGVEKALARVQSMVRHPEGRDQYMRLVKTFQKSKMTNGGDAKK